MGSSNRPLHCLALTLALGALTVGCNIPSEAVSEHQTRGGCAEATTNAVGPWSRMIQMTEASETALRAEMCPGEASAACTAQVDLLLEMSDLGLAEARACLTALQAGRNAPACATDSGVVVSSESEVSVTESPLTAEISAARASIDAVCGAAAASP